MSWSMTLARADGERPAALQPGRLPGRAVRRLRSGRAMLLVSLMAMIAVSIPSRASLAVFSGSAVVDDNDMTVGFWDIPVLYLHDNPSPPTGASTASYNLAMDTRVPSTGTFYNYDTDCDNRTGRRLHDWTTGGPSAATTTACYYANWRSAALVGASTVTGTATVNIWTAVDTNTNNRTGTVVGYLRDYNPATGTYAEIANRTYSRTYARGRRFYATSFTITIPAYVVPAGHQIELKLEAGGTPLAYNMMIAYDTTAYPATLQVP